MNVTTRDVNRGNAMAGKPRTTPIPATLADKLRAASDDEKRLDEQHAAALSRRDELIRKARALGCSNYAIADVIGRSRSHVGKIVGAVEDQS